MGLSQKTGVPVLAEKWHIQFLFFFFLHYLASWGAREDSWESLGQQGDQPVDPKGNLPRIFIGRTGAEAEAPIL